MRILVAEDEAVSRKKLLTLLLDWGHEVICCVNGQDAYQQFRQELPDLVITDWVMPQIDGIELTRMIRKAYHPTYPFVILITAHDDRDQHIGYEAGADDFLTKPIHEMDLLMRLRSCERIIKLQRHELKLQQKYYASNKQLLLQNAAQEKTMQALRATEERLQNSLLQASEAQQTKSAFLANMSHELRTPLNAVIGYTDILLEEMQAPEQADWQTLMQKIHHSSHMLLMMINDLLDISRIEARSLSINPEPFELVPLLHTVLHQIEPGLKKNANQIKFEVANAVAVMESDPVRVKQVLYNLLSNAAKFTEQGVIDLQVMEKTVMDAVQVVFVIRDTGIGMSQAQLRHLFTPFTQADGSATRKFGGAGLGLAITRHLCDMLGGSISVQSELGQGTTFTVQLPMLYVPPEAQDVDDLLHI